MATRPSSHRQKKLIFPTPLIGDLLFSERVVVQTRTHPEYGTPHPNSSAWPNHELVYVIERDEADVQDTFDYFYAAERSSQDLYNWTHTEADIGGTKFDAVTRDYVIKREEFDPNSPAQGAAMGDIPAGKFTAPHVLSSRTAIRSQDRELDSLYVFERRTYVKKVPLIDIEINRETGEAQQIITNYYYRGEIVSGVLTIEELVADESNAYWNLDGDGFGNVVKQISENWWEVSQRQWINLSDIWEWELDKRGPRKFYCPNAETTITEVTSNNTPGPYSPLPDVPVGQMVRILKWGKFMRYTTVTRNNGSQIPLIGEEYGDIVTKTTDERLVDVGTEADAGLEIVSSIVEQQECGIAVKTTKTVKGGTWPNPLDKEVSKDGSYLPPQRYRKDLSRVTVTNKIPASAIPDNPALSGTEIAKSYKKETPDRAEEKVTNENFTLTATAIDESIEHRPFVKILSRMTPDSVPVTPETGNGTSRLVYEGATTDIYENTREIATAKPGLKGIETDAQQWGKIISTTNYTTSDVAPDGGSVRQIFNDGDVKVYEVTETSPTVGGSSIDIDPQNWGLIRWDGVYATEPSGVKSRQVWSNGVVSVFLNETPSLTISGTNKDVDAQSWGSVTWNGVYAAISGGVKSRQVYSGPGGPVYLNETPEVDIGGTNIDIDLFAWGAVKWEGTYGTEPAGDRSRQVWSMGGISVYLNETAELIVNEGSFVSARESNQILTEVQTTSYGLTPSFEGNGRSSVIYSVANKTVYANITITRTSNGSRVYPGSVNVDLPPVFESYYTHIVRRKDGSDSMIFTPFVTAGYRGPMACEVTEYWSENPGAGAIPTVFRPSPMSFSTPLGGFSVGACLHGYVRVDVSVGSNHNSLRAGNWFIYYNATEPASYVGMNIVAHVDSQAYQDGYLIREYRVQL